jgi:hypothetical protein
MGSTAGRFVPNSGATIRFGTATAFIVGEGVLRDGFLLIYCTAVGFVASGIAASCYKMITAEPARFAMLGSGWPATVATFLFCALTGPAIVMDMVIKHRLGDRGAVAAVAAGLAVALLWSVCSGVIVLDVVMTITDGLA